MSTDTECVVLVGDSHLTPGEIGRLRDFDEAGARVIAWQHRAIVQDRFPSPAIQSALDDAGVRSATIAEVLGRRADFDIDDAVIAWFKRFGKDQFRDRFCYGPMVLWWWAELYLYHETPLRLAVRDVEAAHRIVATLAPRRLILMRPVRALEAAVRAFSVDVEVLGDTVQGPPQALRTTRLHLADLAKSVGTGVKSLLRRRLPRRKTQVFFLTHGSMWRGNREMYFDRILPAVAKVADTAVVAFGPPVPFKKRRVGSWIRDLLELDDDELPYRPIRRYFTLSVSLRLVSAFSQCRRMWRTFRADTEIAHRDVSLGPEALACFRDMFYRQLPWAIRSYHEVEQVLETEQPDVLVLYAESSGLGRAAVTAARAHSVASFAVQHGIMYEQYYSHEHASFEVAHDSRVDDAAAVPIPTLTAVFGSAAKDLLVTRGNYDPKRIVITGSPKFDDLVRAAQGYDRHASRAALGIPDEVRFLVLASRFSAVGPVFEALVQAVESIDGLWLVVKPHQAEPARSYEEVIERLRPSRVRVLSATMNLLELLFASDGLVTVDSFASSEALVLGRPVLVVNLPSNLDALVERGVAIGAARGEAIEPAIRKLLFDDAVALELERARLDYIQEFAFGADGRSTERIVDNLFQVASAVRGEAPDKEVGKS